MMRYTPDQIEKLVNWDGLHCKPPWRSAAEERQYYSRYIERKLWRCLSDADWQHLAKIIDDLRIDLKLKLATKVLIARRTSPPNKIR